LFGDSRFFSRYSIATSNGNTPEMKLRNNEPHYLDFLSKAENIKINEVDDFSMGDSSPDISKRNSIVKDGHRTNKNSDNIISLRKLNEDYENTERKSLFVNEEQKTSEPSQKPPTRKKSHLLILPRKSSK
jgi:hypothetical protein